MQTSTWIQDRALVLRKNEFGDTSLVLSIFTREHGVIHVLAKGAHRAKNPLWGTLDLPAQLEVELPIREQREVQLLASAKLIDPYFEIRKNLDGFYVALYVLELIEAAGEPAGSTELFDLSVDFLNSLNQPKRDILTLLIGFELHFLACLGLQPAWKHCSRCGKATPPGKSLRFFPNAGGTVCGNCVQPQDREILISPAALDVAQKLAESPWEPLQRIRLAPKIRQEIRRALDGFLRYHWDRVPRSHRQVSALYALSNS